MTKLRKKQIILILISAAVLLACCGITACLLFSNYQNIRLFKQAQNNFANGDAASLNAAAAQLQQLIRNDDDNEAAYLMLAAIAGKRKFYPEQAYYSHVAYRLNPLSSKNKKLYIQSLLRTRMFDRLENFLAQESSLPVKYEPLLLYAAAVNGNINKYKKSSMPVSPWADLALLLADQELDAGQKLKKLEKISSGEELLKQEILAAKVEFFLALQDLDNTEKTLREAVNINFFAFAPVLGRFYANYRSFGKALQILEKYLKHCHDGEIAIQCAEIYCLTDQTGKIAELRSKYQADEGNYAMLCCYYFDSLIALAKNDMKTLKETTVPLRGNIRSPLANFMFLCVDIHENSISGIIRSYSALLEHNTYPELRARADAMILEVLKRSVREKKTEQLLTLAEKLYARKPDPFTAKFLLLEQRKRSGTDAQLLQDALNRFGKDQGICKIAIEHFLSKDPSAAENLIAGYKKLFPEKHKDMLRYEIVLAIKNSKYDRASELFQKNFSPAIRREYWNFASATGRIKDLQFLSKDKLFEPFCKALILLKKGNRDEACSLLEHADSGNDLSLLFFAAKTLGENGKNQAALKQYAKFPSDSPYKLAVLLNTAELHAENGNKLRALELARQAYDTAPELPETQLCYAGKLLINGLTAKIPDVIKLTSRSPYRKKMESLWIAGMTERIKKSDLNRQQEKTRELCRQLLLIDPENRIAADCLKKLDKMPQ